WPPASARSATTTEAPSRARARAVARPMPDAEPVTTATFPAISIAVLSHRGENAFQFRASEGSGETEKGEEPRLAFVHVDDVAFTQVVRQFHGDREARVHLKVLDSKADTLR